MRISFWHKIGVKTPYGKILFCRRRWGTGNAATEEDSVSALETALAPASFKEPREMSPA